MGKNKKAPVIKEPVKLSAEDEQLLATLPADKADKLRKVLASKARSRRTGEEEILSNPKYAHAIPGTLMFDEATRKQSIEINCTVDGCTNTRRVFTSDLFQVRVCADHKAEQRKAARMERQKLLADFKASKMATKNEAVNA